MPRPRPPHLHHEISRHGRHMWYVRIGKGPRIRIQAEYGTPAFNEAYQAALNGEKPVAVGKASRGSLEWLWNLYRLSDAWRDLSLATRKQRENIMLKVLATAGGTQVSKINAASIQAGKERRRETPSQAKHFVTTMRNMFAWAIEAKLARQDPTQGIKFKRSKKERKGGFPVWTPDDIAAFEARWPRGTRQRVMFDVFLYTGLRRGDAAVVGKQHVRNGVISLQTEKTGTWVHIPILPELQATLDAGPTGDLAFIGNAITGAPLKKEVLGNFFGAACRAAGIKKSAHGLRKAAATNVADRGGTDSELDALFGWEDGQTSKIYTKASNRKRLAVGAAAKLSRAETETSIPLPDQMVRDERKKTQ
jgi:integrase